MKELIIDNGLEEFQLVEGGALLRFNPRDQNIYARFIESTEKIKTVEREMAAKHSSVDRNSKNAGEKNLLLMRETDMKMKAILNQVFGHGNDFDQILCGVNLLAVGSNDKRIIQNVMDALVPIMEAGAKACVQEEVQKAKDTRDERKGVK